MTQEMIALETLQQLQFRAETNPIGSAIDLIWDIAIEPDALDFPDPDSQALVIFRQESSFPGSNRRGRVACSRGP